MQYLQCIKEIKKILDTTTPQDLKSDFVCVVENTGDVLIENPGFLPGKYYNVHNKKSMDVGKINLSSNYNIYLVTHSMLADTLYYQLYESRLY